MQLEEGVGGEVLQVLPLRGGMRTASIF